MTDRIQQLFALNQKLLDLADSITNDLTWINKPKGHYIAMSFGKGYKTFSAIILLCQNGYGQDALVLARTLFELTVNTYYIFKDPTENRVDRYFGYQSVLRSKAIKHFLKSEESKAVLVAKFKERDDGETIESVLKQAEEAQKKYNFKKNKWSEDNLADMATEAGLEHIYKTLYKVQNDLTHSTVGGIDDYLLFEDGHLTVKIGSDYKRIETSLFHNIDMFSRLLGQFSLYFSLDKDTELIAFSKELERILKETQD
jgi:hypothetical protein